MNSFTYALPKVEIVDINPELAKAMLETDPTINAVVNPNNRRRRKSHVKKLAGAMQRDEWRMSTDAIGFNSNGLLINGQHRLSAIVQSGQKIKAIVAYGLPEDTYQVIDTGVKRSMADLMHIDKRVSEIISFAMRIKFGSSGTVAQAIPYCEAGLGDLAFELIDLCGRNRNFFSTATFRTAACILALAGHDKDYVFEQYRALVTHDWDEMSEIAKALWKRVDSNAYSSTDRYVLMALGLKVFDINKADNKRISVNEQDVENVGVYVRRVLDMALENYRLKNSMAL